MRTMFWITLGALSLGCDNKVPGNLDTGSTSHTDADADADGDADGDGDADDTGSGPVDADGDGFTEDVDCDDNDPESTIKASDADCDGSITVEDCDDTNPAVHPDAVEDCDSPFDDNCNGDNNDLEALSCMMFYADADGDTFGGEDSACHCAPAGDYNSSDNDDCNDADASIYPGATEIAGDEVDQDCVPTVIWLEEGESASHLNIMLTNDEPIGGFQIELDTTSFAAASEGAAADAGYTLTFGDEILLGFSFSGATIPIGADRVLVQIETTTTPGEACLVGVVLSSPGGIGIPFEVGDCAGY
jgi:hypothetical protein